MSNNRYSFDLLVKTGLMITASKTAFGSLLFEFFVFKNGSFELTLFLRDKSI